MEIGYGKKTSEERKQIYHMYQEIFQDPEEFADYYFQYLYPKNQVLKLIKNGQLASMIHLNPYTLVWNQREFSASYIVAVATLSCYRRQGMMAELLKRAMRDMFDRGELFTYLIPAKEAYYKPFDFSFVMDWPEGQIEFQGESLTDSGKNSSFSEKSMIYEYEIRQIMPSMYKEAADYLNQVRGEQFSLWVKADEEYVRQQDAEMKSEGGGLYLIMKAGQYEGIFFCTMGNDSLSCTNLWLPQKMRAEELGRLLYQKFRKEKIEVCLPGEICRRNDLKTEPHPKIMIRILCLARLLEQMRGKQKMSLTLFVEDRFLPENEGCFIWQLGMEKSRVILSEKEPDWRIGIGELTELIFGYGSREEKLSGAPEKVKTFFDSIELIENLSITEQV